MNMCAFRIALITGFFSFFLSNTVSAWTIDESYDSQPNGASCSKLGSSASVVTSEAAASGGKSCKQTITPGTGGTGEWGGIVNLPTTLTKGDELWIRVRTNFPAGFDYDADPFLKFLRVRTETAEGANRGYNDWYIARESSGTPFQFIYEGRRDLGWHKIGSSADKIQRGSWETYEFYMKFDTQSVDEGGTGRMRAWKNGVLLKDMTDRATLNLATDYANKFYLWTYWNNAVDNTGPATTRSMYVDDMVVTNETPLNTDSLGNPAIGMSGFVAAPVVSPPKPPIITP